MLLAIKIPSQFPEDLTYRVKIIGSLKWKESTSCSIDVSMGSEQYEGERFQALVNWAYARTEFNTIVLNIGDTLRRYNFEAFDGMSQDASYRAALTLGDNWVKQHSQYYKNLSKIKIYRWDDFLILDIVKAYKKNYQQLFQNIPQFKQAIIDDVHDYFRRKDIGEYSEKQMKLCCMYRLEEMSVHTYITNTYSNPAVLYYGTMSKCKSLLNSGQIDELNLGIEKSYLTKFRTTQRKPKLDL